MSFSEEIANDIWASDGFKSDMSRLIKESIFKDFSYLSVEAHKIQVPFDKAQLSRLLQSAMIFADTDNSSFQETAQRICTAGLKIYDDDDSVRALFALIQARLRNFPALLLDKDSRVLNEVPFLLQCEFLQSKMEQTICLSDGAELTFTPFQLNGWSHLTNQYSVTISGPTSSGKSFVLLCYFIERYSGQESLSCAYIVPTRALINQVSEDATKELKRKNINDVLITTSPIDIREDGKTKILYILTQERLEVLLTTYDDIKIDIIIIDEAQIISDGSRGVLLESVIDRVVQMSTPTQFIFSGPLIENPNFFAKLINTDKFVSCTTRQSPVTQNIIYLDYSSVPKSQVKVSTEIRERIHEIATIPLPQRLHADIDKLSYLSMMFGSSGSSVVYAAGKADAEKISQHIAQNVPENQKIQENLVDLIKFVKKHIHKDYALVGTLEKGIGFHYGHMPSLLRKNLEDFFKSRKLPFLVCTSTLLYGLNLPAKNIFMLKPKTGRNSPISGPAFWNLAGRAGRLGKELEGNVFIIDYDTWEEKPISEGKNVYVSSSLKSTIVDNSASFVNYLGDSEVSIVPSLDFEITLGKLVLDCRLDRLDETIGRYKNRNNNTQLGIISEHIKKISELSLLPNDVINKNIGVSIFRQNDLLDYFTKRIDEIGPEQLIPAFPLDDFKIAKASYLRAFRRIHTYLLQYKSRDKRHLFFSGLALRWMRGEALPQLINSSIAYHKTNNPKKSVAAIIRETMENVENDLRFTYVKCFRCYNSLLKHTFIVKNLHEYIDAVPDIPLYLEMGGSSGAMINMMALGLSRTTAESLIGFMPNKDLGIREVKEWLRSQKLEQFDISSFCIQEVENLFLEVDEVHTPNPPSLQFR